MELRDNTPLLLLVPRIAYCVDALLAKYDKTPAIARASADNAAQGHEDNAKVHKINYRNKNYHNNHTRGRGNSRGGYQNQFRPKRRSSVLDAIIWVIGKQRTSNANIHLKNVKEPLL